MTSTPARTLTDGNAGAMTPRCITITRTLMEVHSNTMRDNIKLADGYEILEDRDGVTAVFHNIYDATKFATTVQLDLMNAEWPPEVFNHEAASREGPTMTLSLTSPILNPNP